MMNLIMWVDRMKLLNGGVLSVLSLMVLLMSGLAGCSNKIVVPPITFEAARLQLEGKFVWYDLYTTDMTASLNFYDRVFGWRFERTNQGNPRVKNIMSRDGYIGNMIGREAEQGNSQWLSYMSVPDVDEAYDKAVNSGAAEYLTPKELPNRGRVAVFIDPHKAPVALLTSPIGDPPDARFKPGLWIGAELWTPNVDEAVAFYSGLVNYEARKVDVHEKVSYTLLLSQHRPRAGVVSIPQKGVDPQWIPYVGVENINTTVRLIKDNGGRILVEPQSDVKSGRVAIFADPAGAVLGVQELEPEED